MTASSSYTSPQPLADRLSAFGSPQLDPYSFLKAFDIAKAKDTKFSDYYKPSAGYSTLLETTPTPTPSGPTNEFSNPVPDEDEQRYLRRASIDAAFNAGMLKDYYDVARQQNLASIADTYPILSQAAREAAQRNYDYSLAYALQKQQFPTTIQDIAASRQLQKHYAGETANSALRAMADANTSAVNFAQATVPRLGRGG